MPSTFTKLPSGDAESKPWHSTAGVFASPILAAAVGLLILAAPTVSHAATPCESLRSSQIPGVTVTTAVDQPAGDLTLPGGQTIPGLPAFCRASGRLTPSSDSDIGFELWIPSLGAWNGKTMVVGNGGYMGIIRYDELEPALRRGYAVISSDSGHEDKADYRNENLNWGVGHPDKIIDWAHRSVHASAVASRALVKMYAGRDATRAYYFGCSTGGGQGLAAAQRHPEDFDGIIAGAPGNNRAALNAGFLWMATQNMKTQAGYIPPAKLPAINRAAIAACDAKDGLVDGLIGEPGQCHFDLKVLQCKGKADGDDCLTSAQTDTLKRLYAGAQNPRTKAQIYPGFPVGSEFGYAGGWGYGIEGPQPFRAQFFRDWVFKDAKWDWRTFDWDSDMTITKERIGHLVDSIDPDLTAFKKRGGKLIVYQGLADPIVSAYDTTTYYAAVSKKVPQTQDFAKLFLSPGMGHCRGGIGPNTFDAIGALEQWVEEGRTPDKILAAAHGTEAKHGGLATASQVAEAGSRTRPLCAYPKYAKYIGSGSPDDARNFVCAAAERGKF